MGFENESGIRVMKCALRSLLFRAANLALASSLVLILIGCGDSGPPKADVYPVSGTVTGSGDLTGCLIVFNPSDPKGISASGTIEAGGKYTLEAVDGRPGCAAGSYKITLSMSQDAVKAAMMKSMATSGPGSKSGPPKMDGAFPEKYSKLQTSDKTVEVKADTTTLDITL